MDSVSSLSSAVSSANSATTSTNPRGQLTQEDFLKLLTTQLQYQSPSDPYDSGAMLEQMAQLTSLSASTKMEQTINELSKSLSANQTLQAASIVGRNVQVPSEIGNLVSGEGLQGSVTLNSATTNIALTIRDQTGKVVKEMQLGNAEKGMLDFKWDGTLDGGGTATPGLYQISATGQRAGESVNLKTAATVKVDSVTINQDGTGSLINVNGLGTVNIKDVLRFL